MQGLPLTIGGAAFLLAVSVNATPTPAPTSPQGSPSPSAARVEVHGEIPAALVGTWLTVLTTRPRKDRLSNAWHVYRFSRNGARWRLQELDPRAIPPALAKALGEANKQIRPFAPTPELLNAVAKPVSQLPPRSEEDSFTQVVLRAASHFEPQPTPVAHLQGAHFSIELIEKPGANRVTSVLGLYVKEISKSTLKGSLQSAVVASTGFAVVPIVIEGAFTMYRLR